MIHLFSVVKLNMSASLAQFAYPVMQLRYCGMLNNSTFNSSVGLQCYDL